MSDSRIPLDQLRAKLDGAEGGYWKGLEQLAETPEFEQWLADEFPNRRSLADIDRRSLLKFMGASLALAGLATSGCRWLPQQKIVPFVRGPEDRVIGKPDYFATAFEEGGYSVGVLATQHEGRPIKLDGNPNHPGCLGGSDARTQAQILGLYDPDRLKNVQYRGDIGAWDEFFRAARGELSNPERPNGAGFAILTPFVGSPSYGAAIAAFLDKYPMAKWYQYEPVHRDTQRAGAVLAFGQDADLVYRFDRADVVLSLDAGIFDELPGHVRYSLDVMDKRRVRDELTAEMSRLYAVESRPGLFGAVADHRWPVRASDMLGLALALAARLGVAGARGGAVPAALGEANLDVLARDLAENAGRAVVVPGRHLPAEAHALCHAINERLGAMGRTVVAIEPVHARPAYAAREIEALAGAMESGEVQALLVLGGNPVYDAPADLGFGELLDHVPFTAGLSLYDDETTHRCHWQLPQAHFLESWGDGRGYDGTVSIVQPLIEPLYDSKSAMEVVAALTDVAVPGFRLVQSHWFGLWEAEALAAVPEVDDPEAPAAEVVQTDFEERWARALADGVLAGSRLPSLPVQVTPGYAASVSAGDLGGGGIELVLRPDPTIYDGRYANNGWLQELPKPLSNLTWDNAAEMSFATAERLGLATGDGVTLSVDGRSVDAAVYVHVGHADESITLHLGYGRTRAGEVGNAIGVRAWWFEREPSLGGGFDAYPLRTLRQPWVLPSVEVSKSGHAYTFANAQVHNTIDSTKIDKDRYLIQPKTLAEYRANGPLMHQYHWQEEGHGEEHRLGLDGKPLPPSFYDGKDHDHADTNYQWAMAIDLNLCTGCGACVVACQSENNIPVVGKDQVRKGREMHWIRIDRYYGPREKKLDTSNPPIYFQPLTCMHCENAPCEPVCPVAATIHSHEGLNQMVYNRCVGTRYCSNNCPYKVRRFNFLNYNNYDDVPVLKLLNNPSVTVRGRGVMEKCTYCVQRINSARIDAKKEGRRVEDGEVVTACQQACPTRAIIFGDLTDKESAVYLAKQDKRDYKLLEDLNTVPRTSYQTKLTNPNPEVTA